MISTEHGQFEMDQSVWPSWLLGLLEILSTIYHEAEGFLIFSSFVFCSYLLMQGVMSTYIYIFYLKKYSEEFQRFISFKPKPEKKRVLIVIAQIYDECMLFGPTILRLTESCNVHLLCLTNGNFHARGNLLKTELKARCAVLGIQTKFVTFMNIPVMSDYKDYLLKGTQVCKMLLKLIRIMSFDEVYSFDVGCENGQLNLNNIFSGFSRMCFREQAPGCKLYLLNSVSIVRKYTGFFDVVFSCYGPKEQLHVFMVSPFEVSTIIKAILQTTRQRAWYRSIFMYLNRNMYINTYKELKPENEIFFQQAGCNQQ